MSVMQKQPVQEGGREEAEEMASEAAGEDAAAADAAGPVPMMTEPQLEPSPGEQGLSRVTVLLTVGSSPLPAQAMLCGPDCQDRRQQDHAGCMTPHNNDLIVMLSNRFLEVGQLDMFSAGASEEPTGALGQNWRWRVLTADVLPGCPRRDAIVAPSQASQLSGAVEIRMWSAADAQQQRRVSTAKPEDQPGSSAQHEGGH